MKSILRTFCLFVFVLFFAQSALAAKTVTFQSGWNTFSTPKLLSSIGYSNATGAGLNFYKLSNGTWSSVVANTGSIKPLEGFLVYNSNTGAIDANLNFRSDASPSEMLFQKTLSSGWNLLGITTTTSPFASMGSSPTMSVDFTRTSGGSNITNGVNGSFSTTSGNANLANPEEGEAYAVFVQSGTLYAGNQDPDDITAATITLIGSGNMTWEYGTAFVEPGAIWDDWINGTGSVSSISGSVNVFATGSYVRQYSHTDTSGNVSSSVNRTVSVADTTPPTITLNSSGTVSVYKNDTYVELGAWWSDVGNGTGTVSSISGTVNTSIVGTYPITYGHTDPSGNVGTATRNVSVIEPPTGNVALNASSPSKKVLTPGADEVEVARYTLSATGDDFQLTDLYVKNSGTATLSSRVKSIGLYDVNGVKLAGGSVLGTGTVQFPLGSTSTFNIANNTSNTVVVVKASFNDLTDTADLGKTVSLEIGSLAGVTPVDGTVNGLRLVSKSTGNTVTTVSGTAVAAAHLLARSKPTVAVTGAATASSHTFTVTADANNRLTLTGVTFDLTLGGVATNFTGATMKIYKDSESAGNEVYSGAVASSVVIGNGASLSADLEISAGSTKTFIITFTGIGTQSVNTKRVVRVSDVTYYDVPNTGAVASISGLGAYSNVGLPTAESTYIY